MSPWDFKQKERLFSPPSPTWGECTGMQDWGQVGANTGFRTSVGSVSQWGQEQLGGPFQAVGRPLCSSPATVTTVPLVSDQRLPSLISKRKL